MGKCPITIACELCGLMSIESKTGGYQIAFQIKGKDDTIYEVDCTEKDLVYLSGGFENWKNGSEVLITQEDREKLMGEVNLAFENCVPCDRAKGIPTDTGKKEKIFSEEQVLDLYDSLEAVIDPIGHHKG